MSDKRESIEGIARRCWVAAKNRESVRRASEMAREMHPKSSEAWVGNAAALREVVDEIKNTANSALTALSLGNYTASFLWDIISKCEAAVAKPPRNCDVWTEHGQYHRFCDFCANHKCDISCPAYPGGTFYHTECVMRWAQLPYESEVKDGGK